MTYFNEFAKHDLVGEQGGGGITPSTLWNSIYAVYNADSTGSSSLKTSLYAVYNGESNANDSFGSKNGTAVGGLTYTTGKIGNAFNFNGTNAYVSLPDNSWNFTGDFSISFWVYYNSTAANYELFISNIPSSGGGGFQFYTDPSNLLIFDLYGGSLFSSYHTPFVPVTNTWYMFTVTRKRNVQTKIYINGALQSTSFYAPGGQTATFNQTYQSTQICNLGSQLNGSNLSNIRMDSINLWNKELTQSEITELYNSGNGAQYITDNFYKPTTNDALNTYNGTAQGGLTYGVGKVGTAYQFNGSNAYVSLPNNSFNFTGDFTISLWLYHTLSGGQEILSSFYYQASPYSYVGWRLMLDNILGQTNKIGFFIPKPGATSLAYTQWDFKTTSLTLNAWNHIVIVRKSGVDTFAWVNGVSQAYNLSQINGGLKTEDPVYNSNVKSNIGAATGGGTLGLPMKANSRIDEVNLWNKELTSTEITELYNSGNGKQYPN